MTTTISTNPSLAVVFPGQGSQSVGMLAELASAYPAVEETFQEASAVLGYDLWKLVQQGPEDELGQTERTQPAMLAAGAAIWRVWQACGGDNPGWLAGHSLGEYTALVAGEALPFVEAALLVAERGRLMQQAVPAGEGAMAALLGLDDTAVREVCEQARNGQVVEAVNLNAPGQVVIAGHTSAVGRAIELASERGARRAVELPVSVPSHCSLMRSAAAQLGSKLQNLQLSMPQIPVLHNVDAASSADTQSLRSALVDQLYNPVRWVDIVRNLSAEGVGLVLEFGPGKVLSGLVRRIDRSIDVMAVYDPGSLDKALAKLEGE
jgi:[acyl-carrier-protein] S-malonyltransferase